MKKFTSILLASLIIGCSSPGSQLKNLSQSWYNDVIGKWYILPQKKDGRLYTISFNHNGTITGDVEALFGNPKPRWRLEFYSNSFPASGHCTRDQFGYMTCEGRLAVYSSDSRSRTNADVLFYTDNKRFIDTDEIDNTYLESIPPLKILQIKYEVNKNSTEYFVFSRDLSVINNFKENKSSELNNEKKVWEKLNKYSVKKHIEFLQNAKNADIKSEAEKSLHTLLDKKVIKFMQANLKGYSNYWNYDISFENGEQFCKFYEFMRVPVIAKNPNSGEKATISIKRNNSFANGFDLIYRFKGQDLIISLKPYKNKLVAMSLRRDDDETPQGWEYAFSSLAKSMQVFPILSHIDVDLLENL